MVHYDDTDIPANYDRARDHGSENVDLWMNIVSSFVETETVQNVLDLGCGTGRYSNGLADHFGAKVIALDPSAKMLEQAAAKFENTPVRCVRARSEDVPLSDRSVDLVFISMVFHHFVDPERAALECRRVLGNGGVVFLRAGAVDRIAEYAYVPFFPKAVSVLQDSLPSLAFMRQTFEAAGFRTVHERSVIQTIAKDLNEYAGKLAVGGDSILMRIDPAEFAAGIAEMKRRASKIPYPVSEPIDYFVFGL